jgi:Na+-transporting NADH:ubiquinone oxidoreductase subunit C
LGGEVDNPDWKAQWPGKAAIEDGQVVIEVKKQGKVTDSRFQIDGMAGATITTQGVHRLVRFWLGEQGFGKYLSRPNKIQTTTQKQ